MTREEHLAFCKKCTNRKFDTQQGLICGITNKIADFEGNCENFSRDETVKDEEVQQDERSHAEVMASLPDEIRERLLPHQDMVYALVGGLLVAIISAILWAAITVSTEYQIGYMAVAVGFFVGIGVRYFGAGIEQAFGIAGAILALLGCLLGNLFSQVGFIAEAQSMGYFEVLSLLTPDIIISLMTETFGGMDLLFYGIAIYEGYRFAFRPIPENVMELEDLAPAGAKFRLPLVIGSFLIIAFAGFKISQGISGEQTFYYESGQPQAKGSFEEGKEEGTWTYYYEDGTPMLYGNFEKGYEVGKWTWLDEQGNIQKEAFYDHGIYNGVVINYYPNGVVKDSTIYVRGRQHGASITRYEDGVLSSDGAYKRDRPEGVWSNYHPNGNLQSKGAMKDGIADGIWEHWYPNGSMESRVEHLNSKEQNVTDAWGPQGEVFVANGNGVYKEINMEGQVIQQGEVVNGKRSGTWTSYYSNGKLMEVGEWQDGKYFVHTFWGPDEVELVKDSNGNYELTPGGAAHPSQRGEIKNGLKNGLWQVFYANSAVIFMEMNFKEGKLNGTYTTYYESGNVYQRGEYADDKSEGVWEWFYENGQLQSSVNFENDKKQGPQTFYTETGLESKVEIYLDGKLETESNS